MWIAVALAGCAMMLPALWWGRVLHRNEPIRIAVLPLVNLDRNADHDFSSLVSKNHWTPMVTALLGRLK
jgi:hypothetical protein